MSDDCLGVMGDQDSMGRPMLRGEILTVKYNPKTGTVHGSFGVEPEILLRKEIEVPENTVLQPFIGLARYSLSLSIVNNPKPDDQL